MTVARFTQGPPALKAKMNEIVDAVNSLLNMTGDGMVKVQRTPGGLKLSVNPDMINQRIPKTRGVGALTDIAKLYEVVDSAIGPAIYNCVPMEIDSSEWNVAGEWDIIDVKTETTTSGDPPVETTVEVTETEEILNLDELTNISDAWALETIYADGDWTVYNDVDYRCIADHCAGGCIEWAAGTWVIGARCKYDENAYILTVSDKTGSDTSPPTSDPHWILDNDEPTVGNAWQSYWDTGPDAKLEAGDMIIAFTSTDDEGNTRLIGRLFGQNYLKNFFEECD